MAAVRVADIADAELALGRNQELPEQPVTIPVPK